MDYLGFGYVVDSCPENLTEQTAAASRLKCDVDKFGNSQYLCVPNFKKTAIVEYCYKGTVGLHKKGSCLVVSNDGIVDIVSCGSFTEGCTTDFFKSSNLYKYPACHQINKEAGCFYAEPMCQKINPETSSRNTTFATPNTTFNGFSTKLNYTNSSSDTDYGQISAGVIAGITVPLLLLTLGILFIGYWKKRSQKRDIEEGLLNKEEKGSNAKTGSTYEDVQEPLISKEIQSMNSEVGLFTRENSKKDTSGDESKLNPHEIHNEIFLGDYSMWKTNISDQFFTLTDDEVSVLYCFLCSDSGPPDFTDTEWLDILNVIRRYGYFEEDPITSDEAQQTLEKLKSRDFLWEDQDKIKEDTKDEIMYKTASINSGILFCYSSYDTASVYLRSEIYNRKPGEKCIFSVGCNSLLIHRLQMNILTHVTMEDTDIYKEIYQKLNVPKAISEGNHSEREKFLRDQKQKGEAVHYKGRSQDSLQQVTWLWRYGRSDIVRSCIGLHHHWDIYIIDNKAYRIPSKYHEYPSDVRCLLYCLLLVDEYTLNINDDSYKTTFNKVRGRYFAEDAMPNDKITENVPDGIIRSENNKIMFEADNIRHDVMYAFVTECLVEDSDLEFFMTTASGHVISEYCRFWDYKRSEGERCLYLSYFQTEMENLFINKLQLDIILHCSMFDEKICDTIIRRFGVPEKIFRWNKEARKLYVEYVKRGDRLSTTEKNHGRDQSSDHITLIHETIYIKIYLGDYDAWKTSISDQFSTLTDDEVYVLYCFLCSDFGPPDFTDTEWLGMVSEIRRDMYCIKKPVTAQQTLDRLKSRDFLWEDQDKIKDDIKDEIMYKIASKDSDIPFIYSSYDTASVYLRLKRYRRKPGEKCVTSGYSDSLLIRRLQMNILTHVTLEGSTIYDEIYQILNVPHAISHGYHSERKEFLSYQKQKGVAVYDRGRSQDRVQHVTWLWRYWVNARPDIVRSCIGPHPHNDIYIIDNEAYRKPNKYHKYPPDVRCLLYCILLVDEYTLNINDDFHKTTLNKVRDRYFEKDTMPYDLSKVIVPKEIIRSEDSKIMFKSDDVRHDVMYAFVTECLVENSDLEFFLTTASGHVISEYCRYWDYERSEGERCLYVPDFPKEMENLFINKLLLDIVGCWSILNVKICQMIIRRFGVPEEILRWDMSARKRYVTYTKRGTQTVHHARGMIVGCAGAGKTTLLKRLLRCSKKEIQNVKSTKGLEVHEEVFQICDKTKTLKARMKGESSGENSERRTAEPSEKTLSFFDFGGQCAYYACHQIYLTRRAFYMVVIDASKCLNNVVDKKVCDQADTLFSGWTYREYFVFWLKSIHTYCSTAIKNSEDKVEVLIVATHWDESIYKNKEDFLQSLYNSLPNDSHLIQYLQEDRCFLLRFPPTQTIEELERCIIDITLKSRWSEEIPHEWVFLNEQIKENSSKPILSFTDLQKRLPSKHAVDMLRYYHDAGKCLFFNERDLGESVVIDVQWFINAFKTIITDKLHVQGIPANKAVWKEYYETGNLEDSLLNGIWKWGNKKLKNTDIEKRGRDNSSYLSNKKYLLRFMSRLGLMAVGGDCHYVPSMNKKQFDTAKKEFVQKSELKTSVVVFLFDFLPFFLFYRLAVALMQRENVKVLRSKGTKCLYKNAAMFNCRNHSLVVAVTCNSIQLQILQSESNGSLEKEVTVEIKREVDGILKDITNTFHKNLSYKTGFTCVEERDQIVGIEIDDNFIEEGDLRTGAEMNCPLHQVEDRHTINPDYLSNFWK